MKRLIRRLLRSVLVWASLILVAVLCIVYGLWYLAAKWERNAELRNIIERGEPVRFSDLAPESLSPEENGTVLLLARLSHFAPPPQDLESLVADPTSPPPRDGQVLREVLERGTAILKLVDEASGKPSNRLPLDYSNRIPESVNFECAVQIRLVEKLLAARVLQSVGNGDRETAVDSVHKLLNVSDMLKSEPLVIPQLIRIAIVSRAIGLLEVLVGHAELTNDHFIQLDTRFAEIEDRFALRPTIVAERAAMLTTLENVAEVADVYETFSGTPPADTIFAPSNLLNWSYRSILFRPGILQEQAFMLREMTQLANLIDKPGFQATAEIAALMKKWADTSASMRFWLSRLLMILPTGVRGAGLAHRERLHIARLGIRVDRYYRIHGKLPQSLADVLDDRLTKLPVDLHSGVDFVFTPREDGFVIYPVGRNGIDDGGGRVPDGLEWKCNFEVAYRHLKKANLAQ